MAHPHDSRKHTADGLTQRCRDLIRTFSYEDILSCTTYAPPTMFMAGTAAIMDNTPLINVILAALGGFAVSWRLHRMGHQLLTALPNEPQAMYLSRAVRLPVKLTLTQFVWLMQILVGTAVFSGIVGKRCFAPGEAVGLLASLLFFAVGLGLYFLPVYLGRLWIKRYYPAMALRGPTEEAVNKSLPGVRSIFH